MSKNLVADLIKHPEVMREFSMRQWDLLIRQARATRLLATVHVMLEKNNLLVEVPQKPRLHLESARRQADRVKVSAKWEVKTIIETLAWLDLPVTFLKGVAYVLKDLPNSDGRIFSDVDFIVRRENLARIEKELLDSGWEGTKLDPYDQEYYRRWMHELPPMVNTRTGTSVDVHHNILPDTVKHRPDPRLMLDAAELLSGEEYFYTLKPVDMFIHSATHLFYEGELESSFRDLVDLDLMARHFAESGSDFWESLPQRVVELNLGRPVFYALRYIQFFLNTPVPDETNRAMRRFAPIWPAGMDIFFRRALMPAHASCDTALTGLARWILYVRSHYLRMPPHLLIPHLLRKAWKRRFDSEVPGAE